MFEILVTQSVNVCVHEVKPLSPSLDLGVDRLNLQRLLSVLSFYVFETH